MDDEETSMTFTSDRDLHDLQGGAVSSLTGRWGPRRAGPSPYLRLDFTVKARQGYEAMQKGRSGVVTGFMNKVQTAFSGIIPDSVLARMHRRMAEPEH